MEVQEDREQFEYWLFEMDDALEAFFQRFKEHRQKLDFSHESMHILEHLLLESFPTYEHALLPENVMLLDGFSRYFGESLRLSRGGRWDISFDKKMVDACLPQIVSMSGQRGILAPLTYLTTCVHRREGNFLHDGFMHI